MIIISLSLPLQEERVKIEKQYKIDNSSDFKVVVDNIHGNVVIMPSSDDQVYLELEIVISANSDKLIDQAKQDLKLGERMTDDTLGFYVKAPFVQRCQSNKFQGFRIDDYPDYSFRYHYRLKVPAQVTLSARTIDKGVVRIENMEGPIAAGNINGDLEITNAREILNASSVNGDISISFAENPTRDIHFNTVNGDFDLTFQDDLSARVYFDSMNGNLYTAFDYQSLKPKVEKSEAHGRFKIGTKTGVEIGIGGPELSFKSINGNVYINKASKSQQN